MFENFTLADLKNAPLSIVVFLSMNGNRAVSVTDLAAETGFSEKPIRAGLRKLQDLGVVISPRNNRYQLTGKEYQLPLSWGEKILPSGDSPEITGVLPGYAGVSPDIERRIGLLEKAVFGTDAGDSPEVPGDYPLWDSERDDDGNVEVIPGEEYSGNIPGKLGVFPIEGRKSGSTTVTEQWSKQESSADSPENTGVSPEISGDIPEALINNISITQDKEVSKYVETDTYLPDITNTKSGLTPAAENAWNAAMAQIKGSMGRDYFGTMLRDAKVIGYEDGHYTVAVKMQWVRDWVDQRCRVIIERLLTNMSGKECSVSFVVDDRGQDVDSPMKGQSPMPAVELLPESGDPEEAELVEICNDYLRDPVGNEYSLDQMAELVGMHPDPRVLRFALQRLSCFDSVKCWCGWDFPTAKKMLLKKNKIGGPANKELSTNDQVTLELIDDVCREMVSEKRELVIYRIKEYAVGVIPE